MQKEYKAQNGETLISVSTKLYGSPSYVLKLAIDSGLNISDSVEGKILIYDDSVKITPAEIKTVKDNSNSDTVEYKAIEGQSIYDVCIQELGNLNNIISFVTSNSFNMGSDVLQQKIIYTKTDINNNALHNFNKKNGQLYSTKFSGSVTEIPIVYCSFNRSFNKSFRNCYKVHLSFNDSFNNSFN